MMMGMEFLSCLTRKTAAASFTLYKLGFWLSSCCKWWNSPHKNMHIVHVIYWEMHHELLKTFVIGIGEGSAFRSLRDWRLLSWGWWAEWRGSNSQKGAKADRSPVYRNQRDFWETFENRMLKKFVRSHWNQNLHSRKSDLKPACILLPEQYLDPRTRGLLGLDLGSNPFLFSFGFASSGFLSKNKYSFFSCGLYGMQVLFCL
jgi:hypothetical protein